MSDFSSDVPPQAAFASWWSSMTASAAEMMPASIAHVVTGNTPPIEQVTSSPTIATKSPSSSPVTWQQLLRVTAGACTTAGLLYTLYRNSKDHHAYVTITESVSLPPETSDDFVEVAMPLEGEVRLDCSTLAHCKYQLKLNASIKADHGRVKDGTGSANNSLRGNAAAANGKPAIALSKVNKSELCDSWLSEYTGNLHFSPACVTNDALLMTYASSSHESFQAAVSIKDCWVQPASSPMTHRLSFELHVYSTVMDLAVTMILPKGSRILKVSTGGKGSVSAASIYAPHELTWNVGTFVRQEGSNGSKSGRTVLKKQGHTNQEGLVGYDTIPDFGATLNAQLGNPRASNPTSIEDEAALGRTVGSATFTGPSPVELLAQEQMMVMTDRSSEVISFELLYVIDIRAVEEELNKGRTASQSAAAYVAHNRRERREMERQRLKRAKKQSSPNRGAFRTNDAVDEIPSDEDEDDNREHRLNTSTGHDSHHISFNPSEHTPGVHLSYSTQATTSGLSVRKLLTSAEERNYNIVQDLLGPVQSLEEGAPRVRYTQRQKVARGVIDAVAGTVLGGKKAARNVYRRVHSLVTRTPLTLTQEEITEAEEAEVERTHSIASLYAAGANVRVPQSIVKQMRTQDQPAMSTSYGKNPFADGDHDGFVHVPTSEAVASPTTSPTVAFNLPIHVLDTAPVRRVKPRESYVDKLILRRNQSTPRLHKKVRYITRFSQQVRVVPQF